MLIDINASIGHWPFRKLQGNDLPATLKRMDAFGVDKAVVANINGIFYKNPQPANEELHEALQAEEGFRDRFIPFGVINPMLPWWERALAECQEEFGMQGIRLFPVYHNYDIDDPQCVELAEAARDRGMVISIPQRMIDLRQRSWLDVDRNLGMGAIASLVQSVPDAQYMVLDTRSARGLDEDKLRAVQESDLLFDSTRAAGVPTGGFGGESLDGLLETYGPEKVAFGTGTPFIDYCSPFIRVEIFEEASESEKEMIWSGNARRMLQI